VLASDAQHVRSVSVDLGRELDSEARAVDQLGEPDAAVLGRAIAQVLTGEIEEIERDVEPR
jgi:hypothetical protein